MQPIIEQILIFAGTIFIGFLVGIIYDFYWSLRDIGRPHKIATIVGDVLFWILITAFVFTCLILGNWGEVRLYVFIGLIVGFYWEYKKCSPGVRKKIKKFLLFLIKMAKKIKAIIKNIIKFIKKVIGIILMPFIFIKKLIKMPFKLGRKLSRKFTSRLRKLKSKLKKTIKSPFSKFKNKEDEDPKDL